MICGRLESCSTKRLPGACRLKGALALRSARPSCAKSRTRSALQYRPGCGRLFNAAWPRNRISAINARVKFRPLWKPFSLAQSFPPIPAPIAEPPATTMFHSVRHAHVRKGDFLLLVGTTKGAFILRSNAQRSRWEVGGPYFHGHSVYAMAYDGRGGQHRIWASTAELLGNPSAIQRRFRQELDQSAAGAHSISLRYRRFLEKHLADQRSAGPRNRTCSIAA